MRIAIIGYGKMGHMIRSKALEKGHEVVSIIDPYAPDAEVTAKELGLKALGKPDVVIDFSVPTTIVENILFYGKNSIPAVIGTTGWYNRIPEIKDKLNGFKYSIFYSGNFSIGVIASLKIVEYASKLMNNLNEYDVSVHEIHHNQKADSPSGTALMFANAILDNIERKGEIETEAVHEKISSKALHVSSQRVGFNPGSHTITFDSPEDVIVINHSARSREGFAKGAVVAAQWLAGDSFKEGLFCGDDLLPEILFGNNI
ncbi:MAG: 4-hydroxy-tetrahydrodipicolinate reductase [Sphaerochaetaceae bacterium]|nr:4-hydroxy-tetrahydrodipicolinate reductase [Sphaerochaetaceae bacterium]